MLRYRCPLCLAPLAGRDELTRFCWTHPELSERFRPADAPERLHCPGRDGERCAANDGLRPPAVYLRHTGCGGPEAPRNHPYWKGRHAEYMLGQAVEVETPKPEELYAEDEQGQKAKVDHWEIELLREIEREAQAAPVLKGAEMWYPAALLRGTADTAPLEACRLTSLVELCGRTKVGKTVLAMQALDYDGYVSSNGRDPSHVSLEAFLYLPWPLQTEGREAVKGFHQALKLQSLMARDEPVSSWFLPTPHIAGNLRAVFLRPARRDSAKGKPAKAPGALRGYLSLLTEAARVLAGAGAQAAEVGPGWWFSVAFYDTAGEASDRDLDGVLTGLEAAVDVVAVLLGADDFESDEGGSFGVARRRLEALANRTGGEARPRCCLVVTKVDLTFGDAAFGAPSKEDVVGAMEDEEVSRKVVLEWLRGSRNPEARKLWALLTSATSPVDRVFLVFTESLDGPRPTSCGIAELVCWCLGIAPDRIDMGEAAAG